MSETSPLQYTEQALQDTEQVIAAIQQGRALSEDEKWTAINLYDRIAISPDDSEATIIDDEGETKAFEDIESAKKLREIHNTAYAFTQGLEVMAQKELEKLNGDESNSGRISSSLHHLSTDLDIGKTSAIFTDWKTGIQYPFDYETALSVRHADLLDSMERVLSTPNTFDKNTAESANYLYNLIAIDGYNATIQIGDGISVPIDAVMANQIKSIAESSDERSRARAEAYYAKLDRNKEKQAEDNTSSVETARENVSAVHDEADQVESDTTQDASNDELRTLVGASTGRRSAVSRLIHEDRGSIELERHLSAKESIQDLRDEIKRQIEQKNPHFLPFGPTQYALLKGYRSLLKDEQTRKGLLTETNGPKNARHTENMTETQLAKVFLKEAQALLDSDKGVENLCAYAIHEQRKEIQKSYAHLQLPNPKLILEEDRRTGRLSRTEIANGDAANAVLDKHRKRLAWEEESIWKTRRPVKLTGYEHRRPAEIHADPTGTQIRWLGGKPIKSEGLRKVLWKLGFGQH